ncbi:nitrogenase-stabilizing/protective protein NifW [Cereibacter changlensis]|uniref:nitrogenase-stabilizing/protective protein NifW n=1 Tax=Cereibacter changlensis TaxID=402884 RepID=UPI004033C93A
MTDATTTRPSVSERLRALSSAEEMFTYLLLPWRQEVLDVSRLHIMKRAGQYLAKIDFAALDEDEGFLRARAAMKQAYQDFLESTPQQEKLFKVFARPARSFVPLAGIRTVD